MTYNNRMRRYVYKLFRDNFKRLTPDQILEIVGYKDNGNDYDTR